MLFRVTAAYAVNAMPTSYVPGVVRKAMLSHYPSFEKRSNVWLVSSTCEAGAA